MATEQSSGTTKQAGLSLDEAAKRLHQAKQSAGNGAAPPDGANASAAPTAESQPDGLDPEVTNLDTEESDAGGSDEEAVNAAADDDTDENDETKDPVYRVTVNGEEVDVPLSELVAGYSRSGDYTRKTQALAEQRQAVESKASEVEARAAALAEREQRLEQYDAALDALQQVLKSNDDEWAKVDWDQLEEEDPIEAQKQFRRYQLHKERVAQAEAEAKRREQERRQEAQRKQQEHLKSFQTEVAKAFPQWADQSVMTKDLGEMQKTARALGFTDQEFRATTDVRILKLVDKATKFDRLEAAKKSATSAAPKTPAASPARVVHPTGARPAVRAGNSSVEQAWKQLRSGGGDKITAAANLLRARKTAAAGQSRR